MSYSIPRQIVSAKREGQSTAQSNVDASSLCDATAQALKQDETTAVSSMDTTSGLHSKKFARKSLNPSSCSTNLKSSVASTKRKRDVLNEEEEDDAGVKADSGTKSFLIDVNATNELGDDYTKTCSICLEIPEESECAKLEGCTHLFCFGCIEKWSQRENTCPLCKVRFNKIERLVKATTKGKKRKGIDRTNTKKIKNRDQSADLYDHSSIHGLLASLHAGGVLPPTLAEVFFSVLQGRAGGPSNGNGPSTSSRGSARNSHGLTSSTSPGSPSPVVVSVHQTYSVQTSGPVSDNWNMPYFSFMSNDDTDDEDVTNIFAPPHSGRFHFAVGPHTAARTSSRRRTAVEQLPPQRSYAVSGHGSAEMPLEIQDSDDDVEVVF